MSSCETICRLEADLEISRDRAMDLQKQVDSLDYELKHIERNFHECLQEKQVANEKQAFLQDQLDEKCEELMNWKSEQNERDDQIKVSIPY